MKCRYNKEFDCHPYSLCDMCDRCWPTIKEYWVENNISDIDKENMKYEFEHPFGI